MPANKLRGRREMERKMSFLSRSRWLFLNAFCGNKYLGKVRRSKKCFSKDYMIVLAHRQ